MVNPITIRTFLNQTLLKKNNYDILYFDNSIIRNKNLIETICSNNLSNKNIYSMLCNDDKKIVIVIDDIDSMNCGDKNGILSLIKLIREKKTKKQKTKILQSKSQYKTLCCHRLRVLVHLRLVYVS